MAGQRNRRRSTRRLAAVRPLSIDFVRRIQQHYSGLSQSQRAVADHLLHHPEEAALLTAEEIGAAARVSDTTVVRLSAALGYGGFNDLQKSLRRQLQSRLTTLDHWVTSRSRLRRDGPALRQVVESDVANLQAMVEAVPPDVFEQATRWLAQAPSVYVVGTRTAFSLAYFLWFHLNWLRPQTVLLGNTAEDWVERCMRIAKGDVVAAISTGRCARRTIQIVDLARQHGAQIMGITDSYLSALGQRAHLTLLVPVQGVSGYETYVPGLSLINALITSVSLRHPAKTEAALKALEGTWEEFQVMATPSRRSAGARAARRRGLPRRP